MKGITNKMLALALLLSTVVMIPIFGMGMEESIDEPQNHQDIEGAVLVDSLTCADIEAQKQEDAKEVVTEVAISEAVTQDGTTNEIIDRETNLEANDQKTTMETDEITHEANDDEASKIDMSGKALNTALATSPYLLVRIGKGADYVKGKAVDLYTYAPIASDYLKGKAVDLYTYAPRITGYLKGKAADLNDYAPKVTGYVKDRAVDLYSYAPKSTIVGASAAGLITLYGIGRYINRGYVHTDYYKAQALKTLMAEAERIAGLPKNSAILKENMIYLSDAAKQAFAYLNTYDSNRLKVAITNFDGTIFDNRRKSEVQFKAAAEEARTIFNTFIDSLIPGSEKGNLAAGK